MVRNCVLCINIKKLIYTYYYSPGASKLAIVTQQWKERQITNWEYLIALNQISGRTFQDLMQYPVFPWILADYKSSILDLTNSKTFRNLEKPIAVQHPENETHYIDNYNVNFAFYYNISMEIHTMQHNDFIHSISSKFKHLHHQRGTISYFHITMAPIIQILELFYILWFAFLPLLNFFFAIKVCQSSLF